MVIYLIRNLKNEKVYIGKTEKSAADRWKKHIAAALTECSPFYIHRAIRKYGVPAFQVEILAEASSPAQLDRLEKQFIAEYRSNDPAFGYNMTVGGEGGWFNQYVEHPKGMLGKKHSEATRQRMSNAHQGLVDGQKHPMFGKTHPEETKEQIRKSTSAALKRIWAEKKAQGLPMGRWRPQIQT